MKRKQFSEEQIIGILKEAEAGAVVTELCRKHGMSSATYYALKAKYGGLEISEAKRLRALEDENAKLKRLLADTMLDNAGLNLHSPSGVAFEVKIACIRALDKDFLPQAAPAVAQTAGSGRIRPRSRCFLAQGRRFSAQRTDLSSRFRSV